MNKPESFSLRSITALIYAGLWLLGSLYAVPFLTVLTGFFAVVSALELYSLFYRPTSRLFKWYIALGVALWWIGWMFWFFMHYFTYEHEKLLYQHMMFFGGSWLFFLLVGLCCFAIARKNIDLLPVAGFITFLFWYIFFPLQGLVLAAISNHVLFFNQLLYVLMVVWSFDTFAYMVGSWFGKHLLIPHISPKKTWEGLLGGYVFTMLGIILFATLNKVKFFPEFLFESSVIMFLALMGDLFESKLKRRAGVKDSGSLLPGHGGVLDRLDSLLMVSLFYTAYKVVKNLNIF